MGVSQQCLSANFLELVFRLTDTLSFSMIPHQTPDVNWAPPVTQDVLWKAKVPEDMLEYKRLAISNANGRPGRGIKWRDLKNWCMITRITVLCWDGGRFMARCEVNG